MFIFKIKIIIHNTLNTDNSGNTYILRQLFLPSNVTTIGLLLESLVLKTKTAFGAAGAVVLVVVVDVLAVVVVTGAVEVDTNTDVVVFKQLKSSHGQPAGQFF